MIQQLEPDQLAELPKSPGVYYFLNARKVIVYIGKATSLRARVSSYWAKPENRQITQFLSEVRSIRVRETPSALEALILEANEIKRLQPRYNVLQKDDKRFASIVITREPFPQLLVIRPTDKRTLPVAKTFGPYQSAFTAKRALKVLRRIFPYRCSQPVGSGRPCLYYPMGLCPGTCVGAIDRAAYQTAVNRTSEFLSGRRTSVVRSLKRAMAAAAAQRNYEAAAQLRDQLFALDHIHDVSLLTDDRESTFAQFPIQRIEGYDISLAAGRDAVGSLVVLHYGIPAPTEYRRFIVRTVSGTNDGAMLTEVIHRRLNHPEWPLPNLWVVDGGLPQRNAALAALKAAGLSRPAVVGVSKGPTRKRADLHPTAAASELIRHHGIQTTALEHALRRIRDEAHRFAISFHRQRRSKNFLGGVSASGSERRDRDEQMTSRSLDVRGTDRGTAGFALRVRAVNRRVRS
jgi:excinuclease ABC subunit C